MTPAKLRKLISILKVDGTNQIIMDALKMYIGEVKGEYWEEVVVAEQATEVCKQLMCEYKEQLPVKVIKYKQKTLDQEIEDVYRSGKMKITTVNGKETTGRE